MNKVMSWEKVGRILGTIRDQLTSLVGKQEPYEIKFDISPTNEYDSYGELAIWTNIKFKPADDNEMIDLLDELDDVIDESRIQNYDYAYLCKKGRVEYRLEKPEPVESSCELIMVCPDNPKSFAKAQEKLDKIREQAKA